MAFWVAIKLTTGPLSTFNFVQEMEIGKIGFGDDNYNAHSIVQELYQTPVVGTLNDMLAQNSTLHLQIQAASMLPACKVNGMI